MFPPSHLKVGFVWYEGFNQDDSIFEFEMRTMIYDFGSKS